MNIKKTLEQINQYFHNVWHDVDCADAEPIITKLLEELYGDDIWEQLDVLSISKSNGIPFDPPTLLIEQLDSGN